MMAVHFAIFVAAGVVGWCGADLAKAVGRSIRRMWP